MSWLRALDVIGSGLRAERVRMDVIAQNIANADVTRTPQGGPYRRKQVIFTSRPAFLPAIYLPPIVKFAVMPAAFEPPAAQVKVAGVVDDPSPPKLVYEPGHPDADANGYVQMPNVDVPLEMADLLAAARAYEANARALQVLRQSLERALDLLR